MIAVTSTAHRGTRISFSSQCDRESYRESGCFPIAVTSTAQRGTRISFSSQCNRESYCVSAQTCDNENIQAPVPKRAKANNRQSTLSWKTQTDVDMVPHTLRFLPARETGPQLSSAESHSPMSLFKLFFSESAVSTLCHNTNAQAAKATAKGCKNKWKDVSIGEMYRYIGLLFYMAMVNVSSISDYWRQSSVFSVPFPATDMSRDRYRTISRNVHMSHADADKVNDRKRGTAEHDRLFRVKPLMDTIYHTFLGSGYHVYMDNFYTSPKLLKDLFAVKFGACGTYRDNRKDCPRNAANSLSKKSARGSIRWIRDGPLVFVKWMDTREVSVCSTIHSAHSGDTVQRRVKSQGTLRTKTFPCPAPVTAYNKHMGGVDLSDQLIQYYTTQHKTIKWYRKIFLHFLDIASTNSFILHKELHGNISHKEFMQQLITELCGWSQKAAPNRTSTDHIPVPGAELRWQECCDGWSPVLCALQSSAWEKTPWKCQACSVHLCLQLNKNCFQEWHKDV
ncbi:PiggyBac transposable element-derived protein 4 [Anabarilius grahami]|uniref:PiggyBac transposable element-derived protein 4 n=1 Tax=Anabarilius grahami TaxID=495550 RepID=A0A3N0Y137_ANAGA|nr:PiggyBac transposable element-derived protein 4 [Anabarilius grahami]